MNLLRKLSKSTTFAVWASYLAKSFQLVFLAPFAALYMPAEELNILLIILTLLGMLHIAEAGFTPTFSRILAQVANASPATLKKSIYNKLSPSDTNIEHHISSIISASTQCYLYLALLSGTILACTGSVFLLKPVMATPDQGGAWLAWGVVCMTLYPIIYLKKYVSLYEGRNQIARLAKIKTICLGVSSTILAALLLNEANILALITTIQLGELGLGMILMKGFSKIPGSRHAKQPPENQLIELKNNYAKLAFSASWRSGLGLLLGFSIFQISGILYAQVAPPEESSLMLMALRLLQAARQFSNTPFYTKIPALNSLYTNQKYSQLTQSALTGIKRSIIVFLSISLLIMVAGTLFPSLRLFPSVHSWYLISVAGVVERYGAMHLQIYSLTGNIIWHKLNGMTAATYCLLIIFFSSVSVKNPIPIAMILSYVFVYSPIAVRISYGNVLIGRKVSTDLTTPLATIFLLTLVYQALLVSAV